MAYALRVLAAFVAATAAGELLEYVVRTTGSLGRGSETAWVGILAFVPALVAALWAGASAKRVQNAFAAGIIWALVAHVGHALTAGYGSEAAFYWTRALVYRSALCVGVVVLIWGTLRRLGRMRGERANEHRGTDHEDAAITEAPRESARPWAVFARHPHGDGDDDVSRPNRET